MEFESELKKFQTYFNEQTDFPLAKQDQHARREYGSPWWWRLLAILMAEFHLSEEKAMDMSALRAALLFSAKGEADGKLKLWGNEDDSFDAFCQQMDARNVEFPPPKNFN